MPRQHTQPGRRVTPDEAGDGIIGHGPFDKDLHQNTAASAATSTGMRTISGPAGSTTSTTSASMRRQPPLEREQRRNGLS